MNPLQERLQAFLNFEDISVRAFERQCNIKAGTASKMTEKSYGTTFHKIAKAFPKLNIDWLKTGEGEMLNPVQNRNIRDINGNSNFVQNDHSINISELKVKIDDELANDLNVPSNIESLQNDVKKLRQLLFKAEKEIARLEGKCEQQNETIKMLIGK